MDKPNVFKSSNFHMTSGDILHVILKSETDDNVSIHLMGTQYSTAEDYGGDLLQDYDSNTYTEVVIGTQRWIVENFKCTHYKDGTVIPNLTLAADWLAEDGTVGHDGAYCWYNNDAVTYADYGLLYNWYAVNNAHILPYLTRDGVEESGWRVSTKTDWDTLIAFLGGTKYSGKLKEGNNDHWVSLLHPYYADNSTGLTILPSGRRFHPGTASFSSIGNVAWMWTATESGSNAYSLYMELADSYSIQIPVKGFGCAVRLIRDA